MVRAKLIHAGTLQDRLIEALQIMPGRVRVRLSDARGEELSGPTERKNVARAEVRLPWRHRAAFVDELRKLAGIEPSEKQKSR
jgi:hypothetical protein